jgi:predicted N-acetyltransferase YhbS
MQKDIEIRKSKTDDMNDLAALTTELGYSTTNEQMRNRMEILCSLENYWTFVAEKNNSILGYIGLSKIYSWENDDFYLRVQALVVKKEERKNGIGQKLMRTAEEPPRSA